MDPEIGKVTGEKKFRVKKRRKKWVQFY
jgi:hypothetical protein